MNTDDPLDPWVVHLYLNDSGPEHPRGPVRVRVTYRPDNLARPLSDAEIDGIAGTVTNVIANILTQREPGTYTVDFTNASRTDAYPGADADATEPGSAALRGSSDPTANAEAVAIAVALADALAEPGPDSDTGTYTDAYADTNPDT